jgi:CRP-like cAMP-binding protein
MLELVRMLSERLRATTLQLEDALFLPAPARVARTLLRLGALHGRAARGGLEIDIDLSQRELGELAGLARESVNKQLSSLRDAGTVVFGQRTMTLADIAALQALASDAEGLPLPV